MLLGSGVPGHLGIELSVQLALHSMPKLLITHPLTHECAVESSCDPGMAARTQYEVSLALELLKYARYVAWLLERSYLRVHGLPGLIIRSRLYGPLDGGLDTELHTMARLVWATDFPGTTACLASPDMIDALDYLLSLVWENDSLKPWLPWQWNLMTTPQEFPHTVMLELKLVRLTFRRFYAVLVLTCAPAGSRFAHLN